MSKSDGPDGCANAFWYGVALFISAAGVGAILQLNNANNQPSAPDTRRETRQPGPQSEGNSYLEDTIKEQRQIRRSMIDDFLGRRQHMPMQPPNNPYANQGIEPPPGMPNLGGQSQQERVRCFEVEDMYGNRGVECRRSN